MDFDPAMGVRRRDVVLTTGWVSQVLMARGVSTRGARGILGAAPLVIGGLIIATLPYIDGAGLQIALLVLGSGLCGVDLCGLPADAR